MRHFLQLKLVKLWCDAVTPVSWNGFVWQMNRQFQWTKLKPVSASTNQSMALIPIATVYGYGKRPNCTNVTCDSRTIFSLHLHKQIASQKEWTEILNLHFFSSSAQPIERFDSIISSGYVLHTVLMKSVTTVVTTTVLGSTICVYTSVVPVNMLFIHWDVTTRADTWRDEAVNRYQQQQTTTTTLLK